MSRWTPKMNAATCKYANYNLPAHRSIHTKALLPDHIKILYVLSSIVQGFILWSEKHQKLRVSQFHLQWNRGDVTTGFTLYRAAWHSLSKGWSLGLGACMVWSPCREFLIETVCIVNVLYSKQIVWWRRKEAVNDSFRVGALLQLPCPYLQKLKKHLILQPGYIS